MSPTLTKIATYISQPLSCSKNNKLTGHHFKSTHSLHFSFLRNIFSFFSTLAVTVSILTSLTILSVSSLYSFKMCSSTSAPPRCAAFLDPEFNVLRGFRARPHFWSPNVTDAMAFRDEKFKKFNYRAPKPVPAFDAHYDEHIPVGSRNGNGIYFSVEAPVFNHAGSRIKEAGRPPFVKEPKTFQSEFLQWFFVVAMLMGTLFGLELLSYVFGGVVTGVAMGLTASCAWSYGKKWLETEDEFQI